MTERKGMVLEKGDWADGVLCGLEGWMSEWDNLIRSYPGMNGRTSRRRFLRDASIGVLGIPYVIASSVLGGAGRVAPSSRITMGCIGVGGKRPGGQGTVDLQGFLGRNEVQVVAVCDVDTVHRNRARDIVNAKYGSRDCATYSDLSDLLARDDIDAVSNVLPDHWHAIAAVTAARAGKDIFSQKPLAYTI
ncbi:MAG: Gfo/Idh/MocA family oxidoreductase, partial [Phycisphaerales bacterium]